MTKTPVEFQKTTFVIRRVRILVISQHANVT